MHINFALPWQDPVLVFTLILLIILLVPLLLERLKVPSILGFIFSGILIGKYGFHIISRDASIELFGTVGILYLMFIAGLEIDLNEFIKNKTKGIVFGIATVLIPLAASIPVFYFVFGYSLVASILIGGIFTSHTLVTYPLISKLGIAKNLAVNIAIAGTLIADVSALLILAIITNNVLGEFEIAFWLRFVFSIAVFGLVVFGLIPRIGRWFFKKVSDSVLQYIFVLSVVFMSAFGAMLAGLEPIVGAFFAGLSLNRLIPHSSPLMNRIDFIGNAIFIPFFLIGVGMLINYQGLLHSVGALLITLVMSVIAIASKHLAAHFTAFFFKLSKNQANLIFGLSNARVAAALAIALIGFDLVLGQAPNGDPVRLLDADIFNGVIIMILITSTVSSFVTQSAGKKIAEDDLKYRMPADGQPSETTLIGLANEATAANLIDLAISTIDTKIHNRVFGLHIITETNENNEGINRAEKLISDAEKHASSADIFLEPVIRYDLNIASGIIHTIKEKQVNHFFIGLHEKASIIDSFFGNLTNDLLRSVESTIYINKLFQPISTIQKFVVVIPPRAYLEKGFCEWFKRLVQVAKNTGNKLCIYASSETDSFIKQKMKLVVDYRLVLFDDFNDILIISKEIENNTMVVVNMARKNSISHEYNMKKIGHYLVKYFDQVNFMLVYPSAYGELTQAKPVYDASLKENVVDIKDSISKIFKKE